MCPRLFMGSMGTSDPANRVPGLRTLRQLYQTLDEDMVASFRYVEPMRENLATCSLQYLRLYKEACSGVESVFSLWYDVEIRSKKKPRFPDYYPLLDRLLVDPETSLRVRRNSALLFTPFGGWKGKEGIPTWWEHHQIAKHRLDRVNFKHASMENTLNALGAFYIALHDVGTRKTYPVETRVFVPLW